MRLYNVLMCYFLTKNVFPSSRSNVGFSGARKHAGRMFLYIYSTNPAIEPSGAVWRTKHFSIKYNQAE